MRIFRLPVLLSTVAMATALIACKGDEQSSAGTLADNNPQSLQSPPSRNQDQQSAEKDLTLSQRVSAPLLQYSPASKQVRFSFLHRFPESFGLTSNKFKFAQVGQVDSKGEAVLELSDFKIRVTCVNESCGNAIVQLNSDFLGGEQTLIEKMTVNDAAISTFHFIGSTDELQSEVLEVLEPYIDPLSASLTVYNIAFEKQEFTMDFQLKNRFRLEGDPNFFKTKEVHLSGSAGKSAPVNMTLISSDGNERTIQSATYIADVNFIPASRMIGVNFLQNSVTSETADGCSIVVRSRN